MSECTRCNGKGEVKLFSSVEYPCEGCGGSGTVEDDNTVTPKEQVLKQLGGGPPPEGTECYWTEYDGELVIVDVNRDVPANGEIHPFRFNSYREEAPFPCTIISLHFYEWEKVLNGEIEWPEYLPEPQSLILLE